MLSPKNSMPKMANAKMTMKSTQMKAPMAGSDDAITVTTRWILFHRRTSFRMRISRKPRSAVRLEPAGKMSKICSGRARVARATHWPVRAAQASEAEQSGEQALRCVRQRAS